MDQKKLPDSSFKYKHQNIGSIDNSGTHGAFAYFIEKISTQRLTPVENIL